MSSAPEAGDDPPASPAAPAGALPLRRAVFVDRDGTINVDTRYLTGPSFVELHRGVIDGISLLRAHGFAVVVVSNQSGISRGLYTREAVEAIHRRIQELLGAGGTKVDAFYYCPHAPEDGCRCRKPGTELFERAARDLRLDLGASAVLGDRWLDVEAGKKLRLLTAYVPEPGIWPRYPEEVRRSEQEADIFSPSFLSACHTLLSRG